MGRLVYLRGDPHEETQALLPWYVTGRAEPADRLLIEAHLATCAECRDDVAGERRLSAAVGELPFADDKPWEKLAGRLAERPDTRSWWRQPVRAAWFVAAQAA